MGSHLQMLRAAAVTEVVELHDYIQLAFSNDYGLSIYNDFAIKPEGRRLHDLQSKTVDRIVEAEDEVVLCFGGDLELSVCLRDECWHGPEAMQLNTPTGQVVIWN
ncbi:hypothetical protein [Pelagibius marinus]|uniref:hypothetical protein n=1 Tax=Pelagibius marinus TaxID=2762760 RepID=UPI00187254F7|nr:hypothetical protein [Pelagibius marinus]